MSNHSVLKAPQPIAKQRIMPLSYGRLLDRGSVDDEAHFITRMRQLFGPNTHTIPIGRARMGLHLLAKLAVNAERRRILMSPFTIPDVVTMVVLAGAEPVFYDFKPGSTAVCLDSLCRLVDERTAAVIVTHYHVNQSQLPEIAALCKNFGAYLFDDCAISFGGSIDGKLIGTLTDASVFSFSSFKLLNYFWGGVITTTNAALAHHIDAVVRVWPRLTSKQYIGVAKASLRYDLATRPLAFKTLVFPAIRRRMRKSPEGKGLEHIRIETNEIDSTLTSRPSLAAFAEWMPKLDIVHTWLEHRRNIADIYLRHLAANVVSAETPGPIRAGSCFTNFPVLVPEAHCADIARSMILAGFDVGRALYPNAHRHPKFTKVAGESGNVDRMVASTLYLPTHFGVSSDYAEVIASRLAHEVAARRGGLRTRPSPNFQSNDIQAKYTALKELKSKLNVNAQKS